jgi:curli biogenesis system outer membrane secretion channel CsgG
MKYLLSVGLTACLLCVAASAQAQYASQMDAAYLATVKAVADYKINDEETLQEVNQLREDEKFNQKLSQMLSKLNNDRTKTGKNRRVYEILKQAGKEIYNTLK